MTFLENNHHPELRGGPNKNVSNTSWLPVLTRPVWGQNSGGAGLQLPARRGAGTARRGTPWTSVRPGPAVLRVLVPAVLAPMAAVPPPVYIYSPEYVALCDSLCKVPKRVSAAAGARGRGEHSGEARARRRPAPGTAAGKEEAGGTGGPGGRSVGSERGGPVCAFTALLAPRAWTLK